MKNNNLYDKINSNNIYSQVINQQPDEQQLIQNISNKSIQNINQGQNIQNLTISQKRIQIMQDNQLNITLIEIKNVIKNIKQKIQKFSNEQNKRQNQLKQYNKKLQQLSGMLIYCIGMDNVIKIFVMKKVLNILKEMKKIQTKQYGKIIFDIQQQQKYLNQKKLNQNQNKIPYEIRTKKSLTTFYPKQRILHKCLRQSINSQEVNKRIESQKIYKQALERVSKIHQKHLNEWYIHSKDIRQINQIDNQLKFRKNTYINKSLQNRHILKRPNSLKVVTTKFNDDIQTKKSIKFNNSKENQETQSNKNINVQQFSTQQKSNKNIKVLCASHSLASLAEEQKKFKPKKHAEFVINFKIDQFSLKTLKKNKQNYSNSSYKYDMNKNDTNNYKIDEEQQPRSYSKSSISSSQASSKVKFVSNVKKNNKINKNPSKKLKISR